MMKSSRGRRREQVPAERLDARRVAQIEAEDLQPMAPLREVRLRGIARRRVAREARGDDELRAGAQQLDARLVADLHAPAGEQRDAPAQVGRLGALAEVQLRAGRAELVVEVVDRRVVAACRCSSSAARPTRGTRHRRRRPCCSKPAGGKTFGVVNTGLRRSAADARSRRAPLVALAPSRRLRWRTRAFTSRRRSGTDGTEDLARRPHQAVAFVVRQPREQRAIGGHRLQQRGCGSQSLGQVGGSGLRVRHSLQFFTKPPRRCESIRGPARAEYRGPDGREVRGGRCGADPVWQRRRAGSAEPRPAARADSAAHHGDGRSRRHATGDPARLARRRHPRRGRAVEAFRPAPNEVDLHGLRVDEALARIDTALDAAFLAGHPELRFIHGRSGGRLRGALHARLRAIGAVRGLRLDPRNPGVTIVPCRAVAGGGAPGGPATPRAPKGLATMAARS